MIAQADHCEYAEKWLRAEGPAAREAEDLDGEGHSSTAVHRHVGEELAREFQAAVPARLEVGR